jgi:hypothetical protein
MQRSSRTSTPQAPHRWQDFQRALLSALAAMALAA